VARTGEAASFDSRHYPAQNFTTGRGTADKAAAHCEASRPRYDCLRQTLQRTEADRVCQRVSANQSISQCHIAF
jgi:hypothetical protein